MSTPLLLETIKIAEGNVCNLSYHQTRCNQSRLLLFGTDEPLDLSKRITEIPSQGIFRCRILYDRVFRKIEYLPYTPKEVQRLKVVSSEIDYSHKYAKRDRLTALLQTHRDVDEVLIEKEGLLTDTTIANIAFYREGRWYTPETPLLKGTMRAKLLEKGFLSTRVIQKKELHRYTHIALMNAMMGFNILKSPMIV